MHQGMPQMAPQMMQQLMTPTQARNYNTNPALPQGMHPLYPLQMPQNIVHPAMQTTMSHSTPQPVPQDMSQAMIQEAILAAMPAALQSALQATLLQQGSPVPV